MNLNAESFRDWMPIRFYWQGSDPFVDWCYMGNDRFVHPFFFDTVQHRMSRPFNQLFRRQTPIEFLDELNTMEPVIAPTGFIFHMSRCGSTLVSQMFAALSTSIVISEAPPIDSIINTPGSNATDNQKRNWFRWMLGAFGRRRTNEERDLFIKFDSWNIVDLNFIRNAFPDVPWIFLYRDPVEVIVSHIRQRGSQTVPGAMKKLLPDLSLTQALQMPAEEYCARVLAKVCESAVDHAHDEKGLFVNYNELPDAVTGSIAEHFGLSFSPEDLEKMKRAAEFDAKSPSMTFEPDTARKQSEASNAARVASAKWLDPLYTRLEILRNKEKK